MAANNIHTQIEPIEQTAPDSSLTIVCKDVNRGKASVNHSTQYSQL